jgi:anthranilate phosphoribosyltransferase
MPFISELRRALQKTSDGAIDACGARRLWGALLDDALDPLETGALLAALHQRGVARAEWRGLMRALCERMPKWVPPFDGRALVLPAYGLVPGEAALVPLLATLLRRFGVAVIVHGTLDSAGGYATASVLRELGAQPCASLGAVEDAIGARHIAFLPAGLLAPRLAALLALRGRLGFDNVAHAVAQALPVGGDRAVRVMMSVCGTATESLAQRAADAPGDVLSLAWGQRQSPLHPTLRPRIMWHRDAREELLFEGDRGESRPAASVPSDAPGTAHWIERIEQGAAPVPVPVLAMIAACLYAAGQAADMLHAKALAAFNAGRLAA